MEWKNDFQNGLTKIQQLVDKMSEILDKEIYERKENVSKLKVQTSVVKGIGLVLGAIFGGGLVSLIIMYIAGILKFG